MTKLRLRIARLALALGVAAASWACNAPFIPIPPPGQTTTFTSALVTDGKGGEKTMWTAHGAPIAPVSFVRVLVFDANRGAGVIAVAATDGSYTSPPLEGTAGDRVEISYETLEGELSQSTCFQLAEGATPPKCAQ